MLDLPHVASRMFGTPLMIARAKLEVILGMLGPRLFGATIEPTNGGSDETPQTLVTAEGIAVVSVIGTLVSRSSYLGAASGLVSYAELGGAIAEAMDEPGVRGVILDVDSPGGEVGGLFDLVEQISAVKAASGKPIWAVANESALSAAYAIASAADRLYVTRTSEVGSIGVVAVHIDESGANAKAGLAWTFIFAGDRKIDGNPHQSLSDRARTDIQDDVDRLYEQFVGLVAANRRITRGAVRATQAAIYRGELAIRAGLVDRLGTLDLAVAEMAAELDQVSTSSQQLLLRRSPSMVTEQGINVPAGEQASTSHAVAEAAAEPASQVLAPEFPPVPDAISAENLRAEFAEIVAVASQASRLGVAVDVADALRKGISADVLRRSVLDELAARAEATSVIAVAPPQPTAGDSPIVRRARERAASASR